MIQALWRVMFAGAISIPFVATFSSASAEPISSASTGQIDAAVEEILDRTCIPSASIALVRDQEIIFARAYGAAELARRRAAASTMRYAVGSISKQFTAAAVLFLQDENKISLDEPVARWVPWLGTISRVTLRQLLSHTAGVRDWGPQDYWPTEMLQPAVPADIAARWSAYGLDFQLGTDWQYSNTGYTMAAFAVERSVGAPLSDFLTRRIFKPLGMISVFNYDAGPLPPADAKGYTRYALGPARPAPKEGRGWLFGAGFLAMTASDLARCDIALMRGELLSVTSYQDLTQDVRLTNGAGTNYALGLEVLLESGRRMLRHGGAVSGFTSQNRVYPDDGVAVVVLTNGEGPAASLIGDKLVAFLFADDSPEEAAATARARRILLELQQGRLDRTELSVNARGYFTPRAIEDFHGSLNSLGEPNSFLLQRSMTRGGLTNRRYDAQFAQRGVRIVVETTKQGQIEQYMIYAR